MQVSNSISSLYFTITYNPYYFIMPNLLADFFLQDTAQHYFKPSIDIKEIG